MEKLPRFLARHPLVVVLLVLSSAVHVMGALNDAFDFFGRLPKWATSSVVLALALAALLVFFYRMDQALEALKADQAARPAPEPVKAAPVEKFGPKGMPNTSYYEMLDYMGRTLWGKDRDQQSVAREVCDKLYLGALSAWGRQGPDTAIQPIPSKVWARLSLDAFGNALDEQDDVVFHDVQFDRSQLFMTWATPNGWMAR